jgi:hypothetical protein
MALNFSDQTSPSIRRGPRVVTVYDTNAGCPPTRSNPQVSLSISVTGPTLFMMNANMIRNGSGDLRGAVTMNGVEISRRLSYTSVSHWQTVVWTAVTSVATAGTYTFALNGDNLNIWGCGTSYGKISVIALEI